MAAAVTVSLETTQPLLQEIIEISHPVFDKTVEQLQSILSVRHLAPKDQDALVLAVGPSRHAEPSGRTASPLQASQGVNYFTLKGSRLVYSECDFEGLAVPEGGQP